MSGFPQVPRSACAGVVWPAFADDASAQMLALQYQLEQSQWWPEERLRALQMAQFGQVFRHAVATVPYYGERFAPWSRGGMDWDRFHELPVSTRREIQLAGDAMHSTAVPQAHGPGVTTQSSGSTGSPLVTRGTAWTQLMWQALLLRDHLWHGRDLGGKLAAIRSKTEVARLDGWGPATAAFTTGPSVMLNFAIDIDEQLRWLQAEEPDYLLTHGTNLHALAQRGIELDVRLPRLKQARTYSETLRPDTRDLVRAAWGVEIADSYSSEELGYIALQCPLYGCYHVQAESLIVEVLDETGRPCAPGAIGQVVVSTLHNFAMPLLRYASGDYAEAGEPCACGRGLPVLKRIVGRQRNMLRRPDGTSHWPSFPMEAWRGAASVLQIQLVQDAIDHVEVRAVMSRDFAGDEHAHFVEALQGCLGYPFRITVKRVGEIPRGAGLKYEDFVSLLD
ncbi:MAG: phenylacetate--CoA ligase family protein [Burkholderiales bacterium]|nr:phenylacetate--CoA ligase family protein [Burkholderiales bacterium]